MADKGSGRRERAAQARESAAAQEQRRERTVRIVGAIVVVVVVVGIIGLALFARGSDSTTAGAGPTAPDPAAALPAGVLGGDDEYAYGVPYGEATAPTLAIWEDFQCPGCASVEVANGAGIAKLAEEGKARVIWRPTTFLDRNLNNDASERAVAAWGCAIDAGKVREYHDLVYANQPAREGDGFPDEQLLSLGEQAGLSGDALTGFQQCVAAGTYRAWAANSTQAFYDGNVPGTPFATIDGTEIETAILADQARLEQAIADATK